MSQVLVCSIGPYRLRGRPLFVGLPLEQVAGVRPLGALMPFPGQAPALLGLALHEGQIVPVHSLRTLLALPDPPSAADGPNAPNAPCAADTAVEPEASAGANPKDTVEDESPFAERYLMVAKGPRGLYGLAVSRAAGTERPLHWAAPSLLAPFTSSALAGALPLRDRWIAIVDPARLAPLQTEAA